MLELRPPVSLSETELAEMNMLSLFRGPHSLPAASAETPKWFIPAGLSRDYLK